MRTLKRLRKWIYRKRTKLSDIERRAITISGEHARVTIKIEAQAVEVTRSAFGGAFRQHWISAVAVRILSAIDANTGNAVPGIDNTETSSLAVGTSAYLDVAIADAYRKTCSARAVRDYMAEREAEGERRQRAMARYAELADAHYHHSDVPRIMAMLERHRNERDNPDNTKPIRRLFERLDEADDADRPMLVGRYLGLKEQAADARDHPEPVPGHGRLG